MAEEQEKYPTAQIPEEWLDDDFEHPCIKVNPEWDYAEAFDQAQVIRERLTYLLIKLSQHENQTAFANLSALTEVSEAIEELERLRFRFL